MKPEDLPHTHAPEDVYIPHVERNGTAAKEVDFFLVEHLFSLPFTATDFFQQYSQWDKRDTSVVVSQSDVEEILTYLADKGTLRKEGDVYRWANEA